MPKGPPITPDELSEVWWAGRVIRSRAMGTVLTQTWHTWSVNARNPVMRRNVAWLMTGKMIGLLAVLGLVSWFVPRIAGAAQSDAVDPMATVNAVNTAWTLVAAFLVFGMQGGFVMLESGFGRERESVNILVEG